MLFPTTNLNILEDRHQAVSSLLLSANGPIQDALATHLKGVKNVPGLLKRLQVGYGDLSLWKGLLAFLVKALHLRTCLLELEQIERVRLFRTIVQTLHAADLQSLTEEIETTIDWQISATERRVCVNPSIDEQLSHWQEQKAGLPTLLQRVAQRIKSTCDFPSSQTISVAYFPQMGYLIVLPLTEASEQSNREDYPDEWTQHFVSGVASYFKSPEMDDLDEHLGDIHCFITDREVELVHALSEKVLAIGSALTRLAELFAELDVLLSFAQAAQMFQWVRPTMTNDQVLHIKGGRHPLQEIFVEHTFVPNDTLLEGGCGINVQHDDRANRSIQILTGANGCGKSVYLKQTALVVFLAQIGCFVPAAKATIGVVDCILTRIETNESITRLQSSFMIELSQVSHALRNSTSRSLILLDEFGKGTLSQDGMALFVATLKELMDRGEDCPRTIATTHFFGKPADISEVIGPSN